MGKTVVTYLVDGEPYGTKYSFIKNKNCEMFVIPRSEISYLKKQEKLQKPAFYVLIDDNDLAYIGETENFSERVKDHNAKKSFWQRAYVFVSKDGDMTKSDVQYLEYKGIYEAKKAGLYELGENKQIPQEPNLPEYDKDSMDEFFDDIKFLMSFSGCNIFKVVPTKSQNEELFHLKSNKSGARGFLTTSGFVVLKDSIIASDSVKSFSYAERRNEWMKKNTIKNEKGALVLKSDCTFNSPSKAASYCLGSNVNGWILWVDDNNETLDQKYRLK